MGTHANCFSLKQHRNLTSPASARATLWDLTSTVWEYHYIQLPSMHTAATLYFLENGYTLVPCLAILLMKACPSRAVFAHFKKPPAIVKVFADGYSLFKVHRTIRAKHIAKNYPFTLCEKFHFLQVSSPKNFSIFFKAYPRLSHIAF